MNIQDIRTINNLLNSRQRYKTQLTIDQGTEIVFPFAFLEEDGETCTRIREYVSAELKKTVQRRLDEVEATLREFGIVLDD